MTWQIGSWPMTWQIGSWPIQVTHPPSSMSTVTNHERF